MDATGEIVVLTGASGFLGHHTLRLLISSDSRVAEVRCLDLRKPEPLMQRVIDEELEKFKTKNVAAEKRIKWIRGDIRDVNIVEQTLAGANCVIHCAAKIDLWTESSEQDANELESVNVNGTETLLKASVRLGVHKFIHISSFEVYTSYDTIYYATENTLPEIQWFLFGPSAATKKEAESRVRQYSNNKLQRASGNLESSDSNKKDSLNAIIIRLPAIYGEFDQHYVSEILKVTKYFGGKLQRFDNIWIRQQPIYVGNAAWSLIRAKQRMDLDQSISGEEFHITDETAIGDSFDFVEPFLESRGMHVTKSSYPFLPVWILLLLFFALRRFLRSLDLFGWFTGKKSRLQEAMEKDEKQSNKQSPVERQLEDFDASETSSRHRKLGWFDVVTPQILGFMCISCFLNRTKASLRLNYEPLYDPDEAKQRSLNWYKNHLEL